MYIELNQKNKELHSADFVVNKMEDTIGNVHLEGEFGSWDGHITIDFQGINVSLMPGLSGQNSLINDIYRPYTVMLGENVAGCIYQVSEKTGFFKRMEYHQLELNGKFYKTYVIGFGKEGAKNPLYCEDVQQALIEKDCEIFDDMHNYKITSVDDNSALLALIVSMYMYVIASYRSGEKVTQSYRKVISKSTDKKLIEKYNPLFKETYCKNV